jgi:ubiquinone/menaquinone biosynthesis C-methylase UbiE
MESYRERKQSIYRVYAQSYDADRRLMLGDYALSARLTFVADALSGVSTILDLGCGTGDLLRALGTLLGDDACCVGVDLSPEMLTVARQKIADCRRTLVILADVTQSLPFPDDAFDVIASLHLLQEVSAPTVVLEEVHRLLKPGGAFRGVAACYAGDNAAERVHQAIARRHMWYFLPADELLAQFHRVFPTGSGYFETSPRAARTQAAGLPTFVLLTDMMRKVQELGHNPEDVRLGALFLDGKKG